MELQSLKQRYGLIGNADNYNRALSVAVRVAPTDLTVLITGESGVGKEVFSKIIHGLSARKHNKFIAVNCGAIPEGTIDSELFGHEKGAFTGAADKRTGYFEYVNGGTIFLDEIGEMPMGTQTRLLRILESGEYFKVGSSKTQKTDVRIVAATNVALQEAVRKGKFREDLYYRLNTVPIKVPSLRERREDIPLLFRKFSVDFSDKHNTRPIQLMQEAEGALLRYPWPGNVREVKNIAEQISVLSTNSEISAEELRSYLPVQHQHDNLPVLAKEAAGSESFNMSDREIMYKLLFEMRRDLTDLKTFVFQMAEQGFDERALEENPVFKDVSAGAVTDYGKLVVIPSENRKNDNYNESEMEVIEESLKLEDKEKEFIIKALKKHNGKRKKAAAELGISERTLYRKIIQYELTDS